MLYNFEEIESERGETVAERFYTQNAFAELFQRGSILHM